MPEKIDTIVPQQLVSKKLAKPKNISISLKKVSVNMLSEGP